MNRRDLFKRAGKLGAGLGLAAVVGKGVVPEADDELLAMSRAGLESLGDGDGGVTTSGLSQTTWTISGPMGNSNEPAPPYVFLNNKLAAQGTPSAVPTDYTSQSEHRYDWLLTVNDSTPAQQRARLRRYSERQGGAL